MVVYWSRPSNRSILEVGKGRDRGRALGSKTDSLAFAIRLQVDALCAPRRLQISPSTLPRSYRPQHDSVIFGLSPASVTKMLKKDLTVREHLRTIQSDGGKARWAKLTPEERSAQARKIVEVRWAKKRAAEVVLATTAAAKPSKIAAKKSPKNK